MGANAMELSASRFTRSWASPEVQRGFHEKKVPDAVPAGAPGFPRHGSAPCRRTSRQPILYLFIISYPALVSQGIFLAKAVSFQKVFGHARLGQMRPQEPGHIL